MYRFLICDDDFNQANTVEKLIIQYYEKKRTEYECIKVNSGEEAMQCLNNASFDIVYMDIEMPGINGIDVTDAIKSISDKIIIIFVTAFIGFAFDAFDRHVFNYITKPIDSFRFNAVLEDALIQTEKNKGNNIVVNDIQDRIINIETGDILFFEKCLKNIRINMESGRTINIKYTFQELERNLNQNIFIRCHKGFIVNVTKIDIIEGYSIYLRGFKTPIPIGRTYKKVLTEKYIKQNKIN